MIAARAALPILAACGAVLGPAAAVAAPRAETHLVLVGGGDRPPEAMARFVAWAGGASARILVIPWASAEPKESCEAIFDELRPHAPGEATCASFATLDAQGKAAPLDPAKKADTLDRLSRATGVFFTGGDQARVMDAADGDTLAALRARYASGVVFGGTSAGTAIMSPTMITGDGDFTVIDGVRVGVRPGLGLLSGVIVDQHFVKRQRENRLFGLILDRPAERGLGIDEATAVLVTDGRRAEVVGAGLVLLVDSRGKDRLLLTLLRPGQRVDLQQRP